MNNDDGQWNGPTLLALTCAHDDLRLTDATISILIIIELSDTHLMHVVCSCMCLSLFAFVSCMFALFCTLFAFLYFVAFFAFLQFFAFCCIVFSLHFLHFFALFCMFWTFLHVFALFCIFLHFLHLFAH